MVGECGGQSELVWIEIEGMPSSGNPNCVLPLRVRCQRIVCLDAGKGELVGLIEEVMQSLAIRF